MARDEKKMTEEELITLIDQQIQQSEGFIGNELNDQRAEALDFYYGEPFGNEKEGLSNYVSADVRDTIEWIMPQLMEMLSGSGVVELMPQGKEDVLAARQETEYLQHVFNVQNPGFRLLYNWVKDCLMQKVGVFKHWYDNSDSLKREEYQGLTDDELNLLLIDPDVELVEREIIETEGQPNLHDVVITRTMEEGQARIDVIPPEEFLVSKRATMIDREMRHVDFMCHNTRKSSSTLLLEGFPKKLVREARAASNGDTINTDLQAEAIARHNIDDTHKDEAADHRQDTAMRLLDVEECYIRVDFDGDGIAEMRQVTKVGKVVLINEEIDAAPFSATSPILIPHKFHGLSLADLVKDLQKLKSQLIRAMLDNINLNNHGRFTVLEGMVNLDDLLTSRPQGIVRQKVDGAVRRLDTPQLPPEAFQMLGYVDNVREERTGVSKISQGLDENALTSNVSTGAIAQIMSASQQRVQLIGRILAETGLKEMFLSLHDIVRKNTRTAQVIRLTNREFVQMEPSSFQRRKDMSVSVGTGNGSKQERLAILSIVTQDMIQLSQMGLLGTAYQPHHVAATLGEKLRLAGIKDVDTFMGDPQQIIAENEAAAREAAENPPPPSPEELKAEIDRAELEQKGELAQAELQIKQRELQLKERELGIKEQEAQLEQRKLTQEKEIADLDFQVKMRELEIEEKIGRGVKVSGT